VVRDADVSVTNKMGADNFEEVTATAAWRGQPPLKRVDEYTPRCKGGPMFIFPSTGPIFRNGMALGGDHFYGHRI